MKTERFPHYFLCIALTLAISSLSSSYAQDELNQQILHYQQQSITHPQKAISGLTQLLRKPFVSSRQKVKIFHLLSTCFYSQGTIDRAINFSKKTVSLCKELKDSVRLSKVWNNIGVYYNKTLDYDSSLFYFDSALTLKKTLHNAKAIATTNVNIANVYLKKGYFSTANQYYFKALSFYKAAEKKHEIALITNNLGNSFLQSEKYNDASAYFNKAYHLFSTLDNYEGMNTALNNLGVAQISLKQLDKAKRTYIKLLDFAEKSKDSLSCAFAYFNLGEIYLLKKKYAKSSQYLLNAKSIFLGTGDRLNLIKLDCYLAMVNYQVGGGQSNYEIIKKKLNKLASLGALPVVIQVSSEFSNLLLESGDFEKSANLYHFLIEIKNQFYKTKAIEIAEDAEAKYHLEQGQKEIKLIQQKQKITQQNLQLVKTQKITNLRYFFLSLIAISAIIYLIVIRNKQKSKILAQEVQNKQILIEVAELKNKNIQSELENKGAELTRFALALSEKNRFLQSININLKQNKSIEQNVVLRQRILQNIKSDEFNVLFQNEVNQFLSKFKENLLLIHPKLTKKDIRLCTLLKLELSSKDISSILNISPKSVDMQRYRLRKKLNISTHITIEGWLSEIKDNL